MPPRRLVDLFRIGGQLVIKAVEINPLAPGHQPFLVGDREIEVPQKRALLDLFPVGDPGPADKTGRTCAVYDWPTIQLLTEERLQSIPNQPL